MLIDDGNINNSYIRNKSVDIIAVFNAALIQKVYSKYRKKNIDRKFK